MTSFEKLQEGKLWSHT